MNADKTKCTACDGEGLIHTGIEEAPTTMCERCGGSGKTLAERATQPARRQSQIDIHRITCEEARKIGGGLIDKIPADDVTALGRAIYQRILDSQPAPDHETIVRQSGELICTACGTTAPAPQPQPGGSIDTPELRELLRSLHACPTETLEIDLDETIASINAWKDAACAVAHDEGKREVVADAVAKQGVILQRMQDAERRATDAEAKQAAIQSQAARDKPTGCTHNCNQGRNCTCGRRKENDGVDK